MRKMRKKRVQPLNKILEVREKFLDFRKKSSDLKKSELEQKKLVIDENSKLIDSKIDNASKQRKNDFIDQKSKIDRKMVKSDVRTGKMCNIVGMIASVCSCAISILGMINRFPDGVQCVILCSIFLFFGVAIFFSNTALQKHKTRFNEKDKIETKGILCKLIPKINNNTILLKMAIPVYFIMSVASNYSFFEKVVNDNSIMGILTVFLFSVMLDIISFGLSGISDTFINLNYNSDTIRKIMNTPSSNNSDNDDETNDSDSDNDESNIGNEINNDFNADTDNGTFVPMNLSLFSGEKYKNDIESDTNVDTDKPTEDKSEDKPKDKTKKDSKNIEIASAICHDIKDELANAEGKNFNKKIIIEFLSDKIKKKYKIFKNEDISKRVYDYTRKFLIYNGYLKINEKNRAVIDIDYDKASRCFKIIEDSKNLV